MYMYCTCTCFEEEEGVNGIAGSELGMAADKRGLGCSRVWGRTDMYMYSVLTYVQLRVRSMCQNTSAGLTMVLYVCTSYSVHNISSNYG